MIKKINYIFFLLIIIFLPLQGIASGLLAQTDLPSSTAFWLLHWYEPVLLVVFGLNLISFFLSLSPRFSVSAAAQKDSDKLKLGLRNRGIIFASIALLLLGFVSVFFASPSISLGLEGFRFTLLGIVFLLTALLSQIDNKQISILIKTYLVMAVVLSVWAIIERFFSIFYWDTLKISLPVSRFGWGYYDAGGWLQSTAFSIGPNQLASYLLPAFFILLQKLISNRKNYPSWVYSILTFAAITFTFSRSAAVGLCAGLLIWFLLYYKNKIAKLIVIAVFILLGAIILLNKDNATINNFLTHGNQTGHQTALQLTMNELGDRAKTPVKLLFGTGLGTAGPIAIKYNSGIVSESWYFQLILELGIVGLLFWLTIIGTIIYKLSKNGERGLLFGVLAVSVTALFLHTFADNPALTYTLFIIIGIKYFGQDKVINSKELNV
jgi:hypothetical protein